jgi:hypothetical protein
MVTMKSFGGSWLCMLSTNHVFIDPLFVSQHQCVTRKWVEHIVIGGGLEVLECGGHIFMDCSIMEDLHCNIPQQLNHPQDNMGPTFMD